MTEPTMDKAPAKPGSRLGALRIGLSLAAMAAAIASPPLLSGGLAVDAVAAEARPPQASARPNIIVVLSDDLGWGDVGFHGSEIRTPTLDALAGKGVQLDRYYTYAVCSPTRAALMSGRSSLETGVDAPVSLDASLPMDSTLLPQHLKARGYQTMLVGKWHLGQADVAWMPFNRGFDSYYGFLGGFIDHYTHISPDGALDWQRNGVTVREEGYTTDLITREAVKTIKSRDKTRPFFLYLAYDAPHTPLQAPEADVQSYASIQDPRRRTYAAMVTHFDSEFAKVLATVEAEGIAKNTLIIWASDNGGQIGAGSNNLPLRGGKGTAFEGGERVPAVAYWPGHIAGGKHITEPVTVLDWFPTLLKLAGAPASTDRRVVGRDSLPALEGKSAPKAKMVMGNHINGEGYFESAYDWPWKLLRAPASGFQTGGSGPGGGGSSAGAPLSVQLFNVVDDPTEKTNIAGAHPDIVAALLKSLAAAPRAPKSLSEWAPGARQIGASPEAAVGPRPPPGGGPFAGFKVERSPSIAEAARRAEPRSN